MTMIRRLFLFVLLTRSSLDLILEASRGAGGGFSAGVIINILVLMMGFGCLLARKEIKLAGPIAVWAPYLFISIVSLTYTPDVVGGGRLFMDSLTFVAAFLIAVTIATTPENLASLLKTVIYSSFIPAVYGVYDYIFIAQFDGRIQSTFTHPNIYAFYLVLVISIILYSGFIAEMKKSLFWRSLVFTYVPFLLILLMLTQARSAWAAIALVLAVYAVAVNRKFALFLLVAPFLLYLPPIANRLSDLQSSDTSVEDIQEGNQINSYAWRKILWQDALKDSEDARILGKGIGSFRHNAPRFFDLEDAADAHSGYVQAIYELGDVGFLTYLGLYIGAIILIWRYRRQNPRAALIMILIAIENIVVNYSDNIPYYLTYNWYVWAILGGHIGLALQTRRREMEGTVFAETGETAAVAPAVPALPAVRRSRI